MVQNQLFKTKGDFDPEQFINEVLADTSFEDCIRMGILSGFSKSQNKFSDGSNSLSLFSHCLHEDVYNSIVENLLFVFPYDEITYTTSTSGNERLFIFYKGYQFIVKLEDRTQNKTKQEELIRNQSMDYHIISIVYSLNETRTNIRSISLQYIKGKEALWVYDISIDNAQLVVDSVVPEISPVFPTIKQSSKGKDII